MPQLSPLAGALLVFCLRVTDVSLGTLRVIHMVRGRRLVAAVLGFLEAGVFLLALTRVFAHLDDPWRMLGYAAGYASGTALGMALEGWIASGNVLARVISRERSEAVTAALRREGFGVIDLKGEGEGTEVRILFVVDKRRRGRRLLSIVQQEDPGAFVSIDEVNMALGGYLPHVASAAAVRK